MKKVVSVTLNDDGSIKGLLFEGNKAATPLKTVIRMLNEGKEIDLSGTELEVVNRESGPYVRTKANDTAEDNLGEMANNVCNQEMASKRFLEWLDRKEARPGVFDKIRAWIAGK